MFKSFFGNKYIRVSLLLVVSILLSLSLATYSEFDESFNTSSGGEAQNILGLFGSYISDLLMQLIGYSIWLFIFSLFALSVNILNGKDIVLIRTKIISAFISSLLIGVLVSFYIPSLGANSHILVTNYLLSYPNPFIHTFSAVIAIIAIFLFIYSLGNPVAVYKNLFISLVSSLRSISSGGIKHSISKVKASQNKVNHDNGSLFSKRVFNFGKAEDNDDEYSDSERDSSSTKISGARIARASGGSEEDFILPPLDILNNKKESGGVKQSEQELAEQAEELLGVLNDFGVKGNIIDINQGPVVTLYEFEPAAGTKSSRVISLSDDIARSLCAVSARIATIPGRNALGIELPNKTREFFRIRELLESTAYVDSNNLLPIILGKDLAGKPSIVDLAKMPHLLVAGTTGSGKSVAINTMIVSLLYKHSPKKCRFIMIDPKMLELSVYDGIPHLLSPVVTEPGKAVVALKWAVREMENRYRLMSNVGVRNINGYNARIAEAKENKEELKRTVQTGFDLDTGKPIFESVPIEMEELPFIVIIVDEMADLMLVAGKDIESSIQRLAQMARAAGIHLIMATQRPSVDVITGVIKANFPSRVSFKVTSKIDSRTILGEQGAEQLLGMGDMLYMGSSTKITRVHGPFVEDAEVEKISRFLKDQATPEYIEAVTLSDDEKNGFDADQVDSNDVSDDGLFRQALQIIKRERKSSTSYIQRSLRIGYNRAAIIVERLEKEGILSSPNHSGKREILIDEE